MPTPLRIISFTFIALTALAAVSAGFWTLGLLVLLLGSATILPPFPPMVGASATVLLAPIPAALAVHSGTFSPLLLLVPILATAVITLQWRVVAWSGAFTGLVCGVCSLVPVASLDAPGFALLVAGMLPFS